jgi:hypothetical protein
MICAGSITADAYRANQHFVTVVQGQTAAKDIHPADFAADHGVVELAEMGRRAFVRRIGTDRVAMLQPKDWRLTVPSRAG